MLRLMRKHRSLAASLGLILLFTPVIAGCNATSSDSLDSAPASGLSNQVESCALLFPQAKEIPVADYIHALEEKALMVYGNQTYSYVSPEGNVAKNGPYATWFIEMFLNDVSTSYPSSFDSFKLGDDWLLAKDYRSYAAEVCSGHSNGASPRNARIAFEKFMHQSTDWSGHASRWESFPYIETGAEVIAAPSPVGLEHYTKYITGAGVIFVGGAAVPDASMLAARESIIYLTSARPEFRKILKENEVRISMFAADDTSVLPEYADEHEPGGFAMGMTDASMTANANWLCYPGTWDGGGNTVIHEMVHTINHVVFEQLNETYFYERVFDLAVKAIEDGVFGTAFSQNLGEGQTQGMPEYVGEYWAMTVEGYIMNRPGFKDTHDTREWIAENDPELLQLIQRYFPSTEWEYCPGYEDHS